MVLILRFNSPSQLVQRFVSPAGKSRCVKLSTYLIVKKLHPMTLIALMMEAVSTHETSVRFYQTTRRNISEDTYLYTRRREYLKSHTELPQFPCITSLN
jgi:hypothetical protein